MYRLVVALLGAIYVCATQAAPASEPVTVPPAKPAVAKAFSYQPKAKRGYKYDGLRLCTFGARASLSVSCLIQA
jgi:hypothetical protein